MIELVLLGRVVRTLRQKRGCNQQQLAEIVGCKTSTLSRIERAQGEVGWTLYLKLEKFFSVDFKVEMHAERERLKGMSALDFLSLCGKFGDEDDQDRDGELGPAAA